MVASMHFSKAGIGIAVPRFATVPSHAGLQSRLVGRMLEADLMKTNGKGQRIELGRFIVADAAVCHGKPTYKGTRIMVWQVLAMLERGESWDYIRAAWPGRITDQAIAETVRLARASLLDKHGRLAKERAEVTLAG